MEDLNDLQPVLNMPTVGEMREALEWMNECKTKLPIHLERLRLVFEYIEGRRLIQAETMPKEVKTFSVELVPKRRQWRWKIRGK